MPPSKRTPTPPSTEPESTHPGKGRPTPTRKQAEAARRRPLVPDTRGDAKARKAALREQRMREQQAMLDGDERYLPVRDKGPVRRMARDVVDSRRNFGDYFVWYAMGLLALMFVVSGMQSTLGQDAALRAFLVLNYLTMAVAAAAIVDGWLLWRRLRRTLEAKFSADKVTRGVLWYGVLRSYQMRRMRMPKPKVARGEKLR